MRAEEISVVLLQDVDLACEGNLISSVKNNVTQAMTQVQTQSEIEKSPAIKAAQTRQQLTNGLGAIRQ